MAPVRRVLIFCLASAGSFAAAQPTCAEGPQLDDDDDDSTLLQLGSKDEPPPCMGKVCGDVCFNRQNKMGVCNLVNMCDTSGKSSCDGGPAQDVIKQQAAYCSKPMNYACYRQGWPPCCIGRQFCTTQKKPPCDVPGLQTGEDQRDTPVKTKFDLVGIGSCKPPHKFIENKSQCQAAAKSLGHDEIVLDAGLSTNPYGCYFKGNNAPGRRLWFNPNGRRDSQDQQRRSICDAGVVYASEEPQECDNKACGVACAKGVCSASSKCLDLSHAPELGCESKDDYRLVSIQDYKIDDSADTDNDWWDYGDVFVEVNCGSTLYMSKVFKEQNQGHIGMHFFARISAESDRCTLHLRDDDGRTFETILAGFIPLDRPYFNGHLEKKKKTCYFGGFCSTFTEARVDYEITSGPSAKSRLWAGAVLTPGVHR